VLDRKMLRGFQHRSMAISLPFVLHRLFVDDDGVAEGAALAYVLWCNELDAVVFQESVPLVDADVLGLGGAGRRRAAWCRASGADECSQSPCHRRARGHNM
jgi:hypothetical protein